MISNFGSSASTPHLEGHELVVRFGRPSVDLHRVLQGQNQELDPLVLDCGSKFQVNNWKKKKKVCARDFGAAGGTDRRCSGRNLPGRPRWSSLVSSPPRGRCAKSCSAATTSSKRAACSSYLNIHPQKDRCVFVTPKQRQLHF